MFSGVFLGIVFYVKQPFLDKFMVVLPGRLYE